MKFLVLLKKCVIAIHKKKDPLFKYDVYNQKKYLSNFNEPKDDIERSFNQYKCQMKLYGYFLSFIINIVSFFLTFIYLVRYKEGLTKDKISDVEAIFFPDGKPINILPLEITNKYKCIPYENNDEHFYLNTKDRSFLYEIIKRYPFSWHFIFKNMIKIAQYRTVIDRYSLKAIIVCAEYSFTSSVLTMYCENNGVKHINVMHGEKLFYIRDSFFRFHKFYVWDNYYKNLFIKLRAESKQFIISIPKSLKFAVNTSEEKKKDFTYYLGGESKVDLSSIDNLMQKLSKQGFRIAIRPHPRYTDFELIKNLFFGCEIENYKEISIEESVINTKKAISLYSTVLNQAYHNNVDIIIDDITNSAKYNKLLELQYIILKRKHTLLSEIIEDYCTD
jgi:hypothetical protein